MRFAIKAWILTVATVASGSSSLVQCFQLASTLPRGTQIRSRSSIHASAATTINETSASTNVAITPTQHHDMTYAEVNHLAFRALQRECKALGLSAVGTTAALRGRLLTHFGLIGKETSMMSVGVGSEAAVPKLAAAEVEVSLILLRIQHLMLVISSSHFIICTCGCGTLNRNSVLPMALPSVTNPIQSMISK